MVNDSLFSGNKFYHVNFNTHLDESLYNKIELKLIQMCSEVSFNLEWYLFLVS